MSIRYVLATSIAALALLAAPVLHATPILHAAPARISLPVYASVAKVKTIKITLRNDTTQPLELKVGDNVVKIEPGKAVDLKLPQGTRVIANTATANLAAGALITEVADYLNGATLGIK